MDNSLTFGDWIGGLTYDSCRMFWPMWGGQSGLLPRLGLSDEADDEGITWGREVDWDGLITLWWGKHTPISDGIDIGFFIHVNTLLLE